MPNDVNATPRRSKFVSSDFELVCFIKVTAAPCRSSANGVSVVDRSYSAFTVWLPTGPLYRHCCITYGCSQTFFRPLTMVIWLLWFFWTCQQPLTQLIIPLFLLRSLHLTFDIDDTAHGWFQSYLSSMKQYIRRGPSKSSVTYLECSCPNDPFRAKLVRSVHRRSANSDRKSRIITTHVHRRHTGVHFVSSVRVVRLL